MLFMHASGPITIGPLKIRIASIRLEHYLELSEFMVHSGEIIFAKVASVLDIAQYWKQNLIEIIM